MTFASFLPPKPVDPDLIAPERKALEQWLDYHRAEFLTKLAGLDAEQAGRRLVPSLTTLHGLLRHLTKVEFVWFVRVIERSDEPGPYGWPELKDGDFKLDEAAAEGTLDLEADIAAYQAACERSRKNLAAVSLDDRRTHQRLGELDVRWIMIHMIEEYAQHNGHADIVRELIDGTTQS